MGDSVDKFSVENRADEEIKIAVDNVVQCDYEKAVDHIQFSLKLLKSIGNIEKYVEYLNILGMIYELKDDERSAFDCYLESLATAEVIRSRDLKAMIYSNIGSSYSKRGKSKEASQYFKDARDEYSSSSEKTEECHKMWMMFNYVNSAINDKYVAFV